MGKIVIERFKFTHHVKICSMFGLAFGIVFGISGLVVGLFAQNVTFSF